MIRLLTLLLALAVSGSVCAQSEYQGQRTSLFDRLPIRANDIVFLGNSITDGCEWAELFNNRRIKNRGISGDRSAWLLERIDSIVAGHPKKLFLMIGINDLTHGVSPDEVAANVRKVLVRFRKESPWTQIYVQSLLPVNCEEFDRYKGIRTAQPLIVPTNRKIEDACLELKITYIDLWSLFADSAGRLDRRYTNDGLHLMGEGYIVWKRAIEKYVNR